MSLLGRLGRELEGRALEKSGPLAAILSTEYPYSQIISDCGRKFQTAGQSRGRKSADGAQENNRMLTPLQQSSVRRSFVTARYKSTCHETKTLRAELLTEQYWGR